MLTINKVFNNFSDENYCNCWQEYEIAKYNLHLAAAAWNTIKKELMEYKDKQLIWDGYMESYLEFRIASTNLDNSIDEHEKDRNDNLMKEYKIGMYEGKLLTLKRGEIN